MPRPSILTSPRARMRRIAAATALALAVVPATASAAEPGPITPVPSLDVERYVSGEWRQLASIPQWFEVFCNSDTYAKYERNAGGTIRVVNRCLTVLKTKIVTQGNARIIDTTSNAQLQVSFVNLGGSWFFPNREPNYVVVGVGEAYDWAVVTGPERSSAFVLARQPTLTVAQRSAVLATLERNGIDACRLNTTRQRGGTQTVQPFCRANAPSA